MRHCPGLLNACEEVRARGTFPRNVSLTGWPLGSSDVKAHQPLQAPAPRSRTSTCRNGHAWQTLPEPPPEFLAASWAPKGGEQTCVSKT